MRKPEKNGRTFAKLKEPLRPSNDTRRLSVSYIASRPPTVGAFALKNGDGKINDAGNVTKGASSLCLTLSPGHLKPRKCPNKFRI